VCCFWTGVQINTLIILIVQYHLTTRSFVSSILQNFKDPSEESMNGDIETVDQLLSWFHSNSMITLCLTVLVLCYSLIA
jgi:hypothetical protein